MSLVVVGAAHAEAGVPAQRVVVVLGALVTVAYAANRGWDTVVPWYVPGGGIAAALTIGAVAGLYPAMRAAKLAPTEALRSA